MSILTKILLCLAYIVVTGTSMMFPYRCSKTPFWQVVLSLVPVLNLFYLFWRLALCKDCPVHVHANIFFGSTGDYEHYLDTKNKYKQMRSSFNDFKSKHK